MPVLLSIGYSTLESKLISKVTAHISYGHHRAVVPPCNFGKVVKCFCPMVHFPFV
jgi:hypothetical protein